MKVYLQKKNTKREHGRNRYKNMSEENKQRLKEYQKKYCRSKKWARYKKKEKALIFGEDCINNNAFHKNKRTISIDKVDIKRRVLSKKDLYGNKSLFKYIIRYTYIGNVFIIPLFIRLPQVNGYVKYFDNSNKYIRFKVHHKQLLQKYNEIWGKIRNLLTNRGW